MSNADLVWSCGDDRWYDVAERATKNKEACSLHIIPSASVQ